MNLEDIIKENKFKILIVLLIVVLFPILLMIILFSLTRYISVNELKLSNWVGFYGSYYGGIFGGTITLLGIFFTINYYNNKEIEEKI
jgi:uncharacterized membrane protein